MFRLKLFILGATQIYNRFMKEKEMDFSDKDLAL